MRRASASNNTPSTNPMGFRSVFVPEDEALNTDSESVDPSFDPYISMTSDMKHLFNTFWDDWIASLC